MLSAAVFLLSIDSGANWMSLNGTEKVPFSDPSWRNYPIVIPDSLTKMVFDPVTHTFRNTRVALNNSKALVIVRDYTFQQNCEDVSDGFFSILPKNGLAVERVLQHHCRTPRIHRSNVSLLLVNKTAGSGDFQQLNCAGRSLVQFGNQRLPASFMILTPSKRNKRL
jgi:hypothetical protein